MFDRGECRERIEQSRARRTQFVGKRSETRLKLGKAVVEVGRQGCASILGYAKNLRFEDAPGSTTAPLLVLAEFRVESERERAEAAKRLEQIDAELPLTIREARQASQTRDRLLTNTARTISEELQGAADRFAPRSYRSTQVPAVLDRGIADAKKIDVAKELQLVQDALRTTAQPVAIDELVRHPSWSRWVEQGLSLHEGRDDCLFCGSSTARRRAADAATRTRRRPSTS